MFKFENGKLIKKAYTLINGIEYETKMPEYEGKTPLEAEILNQALEENILATEKSKLEITEEPASGAIITIPLNYKVGAGCLDVYLEGERLIACSIYDDNTTGHYSEVGDAGTISNQIKITTDWNLEVGDILQFIVRGAWENDTEMQS